MCAASDAAAAATTPVFRCDLKRMCDGGSESGRAAVVVAAFRLYMSCGICRSVCAGARAVGRAIHGERGARIIFHYSSHTSTYSVSTLIVRLILSLISVELRNNDRPRATGGGRPRARPRVDGCRAHRRCSRARHTYVGAMGARACGLRLARPSAYQCGQYPCVRWQQFNHMRQS